MSKIALQVESNVEAPSLARQSLLSIRSALEPRFNDVVLLVSELVANSVRHSDSPDIAVSVKTNPQRIRVEVADSGFGMATVAHDGDGLGLQIVERLADGWGFSAGSKFIVWAELSKS